jgi:hypothetical protein
MVPGQIETKKVPKRNTSQSDRAGNETPDSTFKIVNLTPLFLGALFCTGGRRNAWAHNDENSALVIIRIRAPGQDNDRFKKFESHVYWTNTLSM